ncbi:hypothetical protein B0J11DRAFT_270211 [Dendryphion nanum]|uniref:Uncharacterized protein n=1 Tax=Dendryphion nanum TaxID=256645 RepID=A0A9P9E023_9PLEO|nr:hypothetical protein B0J11DRAFT_270211 [Dendryphion nanum]
MPILKRDNGGYAIHPLLIVLLIMLGAAFVVACGAGISRFATKDKKDDAFKDRSEEQNQYMREVRARNVDGLVYQSSMGQQRQPNRPPYGRETPSTYSYSEV